MQLSTLKQFSKAIALPLFFAILNTATIANAKQLDSRPNKISRQTPHQTIAKSKGAKTLPSVIDLNILVPVAASEIDPSTTPARASSKGLPPAPIIEPFWSNPDDRDDSVRDRNSTPAASERKANKAKEITKSKKLSADRKPPLSLSLISDKPSKVKSIAKDKVVVATNTDNRMAIDKEISRPKSAVKVAAISRPLLGGNYLRLVRTANQRVNEVGNPIYTLEAYVNGKIERTFNVVSGTATTQNIDRSQGNNFAPLPDGAYIVSDRIIPGMTPEVGKTFISIFPRFETERENLGIHLDRSFNKSNGYDGTAGCIGMTTIADRDAINEFVTKYQPRNLFVKIAS
jgi:hypothetical protein